MKLPIKDEFFKQIQNGSKNYEVRDAHITFINEKTKEELTKKIFTAGIGPRKKVLDMANLNEDLIKECIEDGDTLVWFYLD